MACIQFTSSLIFPFSMNFLVPNHTDCECQLPKSNCTKSFFSVIFPRHYVSKWVGIGTMRGGGVTDKSLGRNKEWGSGYELWSFWCKFYGSHYLRNVLSLPVIPTFQITALKGPCKSLKSTTNFWFWRTLDKRGL